VLKAAIRFFSGPLGTRRKQAGAHQVRHPLSRIQPQELPRHVEPFAKFGYNGCEIYTRVQVCVCTSLCLDRSLLVQVSAWTGHCLYRSLFDLIDHMERGFTRMSDSCLSIQVVPCPLKNPKVLFDIHIRSPPSHWNPVHTFTPYFFKIIFLEFMTEGKHIPLI